jgi:ferredoxin--NADP+ reductase
MLPGKNLYLFSTGTGLAPFLSIIRDPECYEAFDKIILTHGVRSVSELAYQDLITDSLPDNEYFGEEVRDKLIYYPSVTREDFRFQGRITDLIESGKLFTDVGMPPLNPKVDRAMLCGSPAMLKDTTAILDKLGFRETRHGDLGTYVIERAFVE